MGTLRKVKRKMMLDRDLRKTLVRSAKDEILLDVDGDGAPDILLLDSTGDGDIDTLAVDLSGDGEFDLYFHDSDANGIPDMILLDSDGDGELELAGVGQEVEDAMIGTAQAILDVLTLGDYIVEELDAALDELDKEVRQARKALQELN
ncbi:MAG: hypothetical protein LUE21_04440 [Oscillospiraceae bacterium]|nr:hypothetical protein [Oscillospiraceae bacterium]